MDGCRVLENGENSFQSVGLAGSVPARGSAPRCRNEDHEQVFAVFRRPRKNSSRSHESAGKVEIILHAVQIAKVSPRVFPPVSRHFARFSAVPEPAEGSVLL